MSYPQQNMSVPYQQYPQMPPPPPQPAPQVVPAPCPYNPKGKKCTAPKEVPCGNKVKGIFGTKCGLK